MPSLTAESLVSSTGSHGNNGLAKILMWVFVTNTKFAKDN